MDNNNKIKEAFDTWADRPRYTIEEMNFSNSVYIKGDYTYGLALGFHGGYTSRDEEVQQLKKDKQELLTMMPRLFTLLYRFARMYDLRREPDKVNAVLMHIYADLIADKTLSDADSLIERMKGF